MANQSTPLSAGVTSAFSSARNKLRSAFSQPKPSPQNPALTKARQASGALTLQPNQSIQQPIAPGPTLANVARPPTVQPPAIQAPAVQPPAQAPTPAVPSFITEDLQRGVQQAPQLAAAPKQPTPAIPVTEPAAPAAAPVAPAPEAPVQSQLQALQDLIVGFQSPTEQEQGLQQQLDDLSTQEAQLGASLRQGLVSAEGRPIPLTFIAGEQAQLQRQAASQGQTLAAQKVPLQQQLAQLQANRSNQLAAATQAAEFAQPGAEAEAFTLSEGQARFGPEGGLIAERGKAGTKALSPGQTLVDAEGNVLFTAPDGTQRPITVSKGSVLVDAQGNVLFNNPKQAIAGSVEAQELTGAQLSDALQKGYDTSAKLKQYVQLVQAGEAPPVLKQKSAETLKLQGNVISGLDSLAVIRDSLGGLPGQASVLFSRTVRAASANLADVIGRLRSGGAINEEELKTFRKLLPKVTDSDTTANFKLDQVENLLRSIGSQFELPAEGGDALDRALDASNL